MDRHQIIFFSSVTLSGTILLAISFAFPFTFLWGSIIVFGKKITLQTIIVRQRIYHKSKLMRFSDIWWFIGSYDKWTYNETFPDSNNSTIYVKNALINDRPSNGSISSGNSSLFRDGIASETEYEKIFCPYTPFMFSFATLLLKWILISLPVICCGFIAACCGYSARKAFKDSSFYQEDPEHLVANNL